MSFANLGQMQQQQPPVTHSLQPPFLDNIPPCQPQQELPLPNNCQSRAGQMQQSEGMQCDMWGDHVIAKKDHRKIAKFADAKFYQAEVEGAANCTLL